MSDDRRFILGMTLLCAFFTVAAIALPVMVGIPLGEAFIAGAVVAVTCIVANAAGWLMFGSLDE